MTRATWNGTVIAESDATVLVEGNHYFPPEAVKAEFLHPIDKTTHCGWKGDASYFDVVVDGQRKEAAAWCYRQPYEAAENIRDHIAFWNGIEVA